MWGFIYVAHEGAHLVPLGELDWFDRNQMQSHCRYHVPDGTRTNDSKNGMLLGADLLLLPDASDYIFFPMGSTSSVPSSWLTRPS